MMNVVALIICLCAIFMTSMPNEHGNTYSLLLSRFLFVFFFLWFSFFFLLSFYNNNNSTTAMYYACKYCSHTYYQLMLALYFFCFSFLLILLLCFRWICRFSTSSRCLTVCSVVVIYVYSFLKNFLPFNFVHTHTHTLFNIRLLAWILRVDSF